jgi:hypothetical protein
MAPRKTAEVTVEEKMRELGISPDGDLSSSDSGADESLDPLASDDDDDEEQDEDSEDEQDSPPAPVKRSPLRDALFAPSDELRPPRIGVPPQPPAVRAVPQPRTEERTPLPLAEEEPIYQVPMTRVRKIKPESSPAVRRLGPALAKKLPGAEKVKIKRRLDNGALGIVGEYSLQDLAASSDIESFILKYIKPKFGPGEYKVTGIDAAGNELEAGTVHALNPDPAAEANGPMDFIQVMFEQTQRQQRELMEQRMQGPNPIEMLRGLQEVQKEMTPRDESGGALAAVIAAQGQQMQAFMQMMAQQSAQQMTLMVEALKPREDPTMKMLLARLVEEKVSNSNALPLPAPPPPPPPSSPVEGLKEILELAIVMTRGNKSEDGELKELVRQAIQAKDQHVMSPKDVIQLVHDIKSDRGTDDFRKSMENMSMMLNVAQQLKGDQQGSSSANFFDALGSLFSNRDFAGAIAQTVRSKVETSQRSELLEKQRALLREVRQGNPQAIAQAQQQARAAAAVRPVAVPVAPVANTNGVQPVVPVAAVVNGVPMAVAPVVARPVAPVAPAAGVQGVQAVQTPRMEGAPAQIAKPPETTLKNFKLPPLPTNTYEHVNGIVAAPDEGALLGSVVRMLIYWAEFEDFRPMAELLLGLVQRGDRERAAEMVANIFNHLSAIGMMSAETAQHVVATFVKFFDEIQSQLSDLPLDDDRNPIQAALEDADTDDEDDEDDEEDEEDEGYEDDEDDAVRPSENDSAAAQP